MNAWNSGTTTSNSVSIPANAAKLASLAQITSSPYRTFTRANDLVNTVAVQTASTSTTSGTRTLPPSTVCWNGSAACSSGNTQYGWIFDLPDTNEQVIYNPVFSGGELFLNTLIPPVNSASSCTTALPTGWTMSFNIGSGGGEPQNIFPDPVTGAVVVTSGNYSIAGLQQNAVGTPYVVSVGSQQYVVNQTVGGAPTVKKINPQGGVKVKQVSWEQLR